MRVADLLISGQPINKQAEIKKEEQFNKLLIIYNFNIGDALLQLIHTEHKYHKQQEEHV